MTLVEPKHQYTTCFFSNLYLAGLRSLKSLTHDYETLAQQYGIKVIHHTVTAIDPAAKTVALAGGAKLPYDRAVVAPGIAFRHGAIEGYDEAAMQTMPHAWNGGPQTKLLRQQLESMEDGGVFVIAGSAGPVSLPTRSLRARLPGRLLLKQFKPRAKILSSMRRTHSSNRIYSRTAGIATIRE